MSYDEQDAWREEAENAMYEEFGPQWARDHAQEIYEENYDAAVEEFTNGRLRSFYEKEPLVAVSAVNALKYSKILLSAYPKAAFVFAVSAVEFAWKDVLLRPMLAGLIHEESIAPVVVALSTHQQGFDRFEKLLVEMLKHVSGTDLATFSRAGSSLRLIDEIKRVAKLRNDVLHGGFDASTDEANRAIGVAMVLLSIYSDVLRALAIGETEDQRQMLTL
jgi:hypothetical protein